ncbi:MAG: elongation factor Ts [Melioribacteraceae bacterium]|nr:elongation factor Ts [Melioribacteraceae bacterium]
MSISASQVKELRDKTGAGMMDCKQALTEANGDFGKAVELLRKKGASVAAKRAERSANEGVVKTYISEDGKQAVIVEVNCETDFVAKSDDFIQFSDFVTDAVVKNKPSDIDELMGLSHNGKLVSDELSATIGKIGEKIEVSRFSIDSTDNGTFVDYIHHGAKLGVLVKAENTNSNDVSALLKDIAMQAAAMKPIYLTVDEVPKTEIEKEKEIYKEVARKEGKPEQILDKIADGRINKFFQEVCLLEQAFIKDNAKSVKDVIADFNKANNSDIKLTRFYRFHLGDEKK